jgi:tetratricopeptide (TPR) repeat protein
MAGSDLPGAPPRERDVLDSWKDIAAYLGRSVRAVQVWEKEEGLPVHRHQHEKQGSVYAYAAELDAWRRRRSAGPPAPPAQTEPEAHPAAAPPRWLAIASAAAGVVLLALVVWWIARDSPDSRALALSFQPRDAVLVAALENRTGESVFDGAIEYLLERELGDSTFVDVVSRERSGDVLKLMKRAADTRLERQLAREVAVRDGEIRVIVAPRLEKVGASYLLGIEVVDPSTGRRAAAFSADAGNHDEIVSAARSLAIRVRGILGEQIPRAAAAGRLERVTSPSLRAVQLFTRADRLLISENRGAAERLLLEAIQDDPGFASAHMHLALLMQAQRRPPADYLPHADRAAQLAGSTTDRERYFILASHASMHGRDEEAIGHYKALLEIDPDHFLAATNIGDILKFRLGRPVEAVPYRIRGADLRPHEFVANFMAAESLANWAGKPQEAAVYYDRAEARITPQDEKIFGQQVVWTRLARAHRAWLTGDRTAVVRELERRAEAARVQRGPAADLTIENIGYFQLAIGRPEKAQELAGSIRDPGARLRYSAHVAYARGRRAEARAAFEKLLAGDQAVSPFDLLRAAQCGLHHRVSARLDGASGTTRQMLLAESTLARGERRKAIELYRDALGRDPSIGTRHLPLHMAALESLVTALAAEGMATEATRWIEQARGHAARLPPEALPAWVSVQRRLSADAGDVPASFTR